LRATRNYEEVGLYLAPQFPLYALVPLIEVFRIANQTAGKRLFNWHFITEDGGPVESGAGMTLNANASIYSDFPYDTVLIISGNDPLSFLSRRLVSWIQRLHAHGVVLGGVDTGAFALAEAGLLNGRRAVCHWEAMALFSERYHDTQLVEQRFIFDPPILTCAGGIAGLDMILDLVERGHGPIIARQIANGFVHANRSSADGAQRVHPRGSEEGGVDAVRALISVMEANIETPMPVPDLAAAVKMPRRMLERLFLKRTQSSIAQYYMRVRLEQAREMLFYSHSSIADISLMCGFGSPAVFTRTFRAHFGQSPSAFRASHAPAEMARYRPQVTWTLSETRPVRR
jgi:transcriptional regulator GlxA family with amidase domain